MLDEITPMILTFNEMENIVRTIDKLKWARRILVIDSGSTDGTLAFLRNCPNVEVVYRGFDSFADQCNFGLTQIKTEWALSLDADYELSSELVQEVQRLVPDSGIIGFRAGFVYRVFGAPLRRTLYPPRDVLYRVQGARYVNEGHGHRVSLSGRIQALQGVIYHDDRKPLARWFSSQLKYAAREAEYLLTTPDNDLSRVDKIRRLGWVAPMLAFFYVLVVKRCVLDGWAGYFYALQRAFAEIAIALELMDRRFFEQSGRITRE